MRLIARLGGRRLECGAALGMDQEQRQRAGADGVLAHSRTDLAVHRRLAPADRLGLGDLPADSAAGGCVDTPSQPAKERSAGLSRAPALSATRTTADDIALAIRSPARVRSAAATAPPLATSA
jgi:hypothetical protein